MTQRHFERPTLATLTLLLGLCHLSLSSTAHARPTSVGPYAEAGIGITTFLGTGADYSKLGPNFELRVGYEPFSWLSTGILLGGSTHEATVPPPPEGEYYQLYTALAEVRLGFSLGPFNLFTDGGIGLAIVSSNILSRVDILEPDESISFTLRAGGGIEYQLQNRHYAFGLAGQWMSVPGFDSLQGVSARAYLRYTY